ncbi:Uncharacterized protein OS=Hoeflea sp. BAL378 GN=LL06_22265 PE=4 SV=1 [Gemmata massiliana]|uniref:Phage gp6-like head-tail connector protein n=1 Tax=Gemmata massiliana TaxID=1210884 RepID=A0A6P2D3Q4_9BACT|nr:head-tail connector protein [Gemmata massiliana]VTR94082.1 Uncharacterized protein OS=Hoeflea sp. BAL378 GN=LL06_22265 PE=4 SV=1 [Gemmata massiliana]
MHNYSIEEIALPESLDLLAELKAHINSNNGSAEDAQLSQFLDTACELFEHETDGMVILSTTFKQYFPCWQKCFQLARGKVSDIANVTYYDENDQEQEFTSWLGDATGIPGLVLMTDCNFPALSTMPRPIAIEFTAGWLSVEYLPADVKVAILQLAAHLYSNRESHTDEKLEELPMGFRRVCDKYKTGLGGI